jgi:aspartyl-tRNA(Asn)/glutamyl-tRNA(Gln) amidotransferase subunit C
MIERKDVEKLAALARITIPEDQIEKVRHDIGGILDYVSQINELDASKAENTTPYHFGVKNVLRDDSEPHEPGLYSGDLLAAAPKTEKGFIKVKKILAQD